MAIVAFIPVPLIALVGAMSDQKIGEGYDGRTVAFDIQPRPPHILQLSIRGQHHAKGYVAGRRGEAVYEMCRDLLSEEEEGEE